MVIASTGAKVVHVGEYVRVYGTCEWKRFVLSPVTTVQNAATKYSQCDTQSVSAALACLLWCIDFTPVCVHTQ